MCEIFLLCEFFFFASYIDFVEVMLTEEIKEERERENLRRDFAMMQRKVV